MKKIFILLALSAFFTSCNNSAELVSLHKTNDSLMKLLAPRSTSMPISVTDTNLIDSTSVDANVLALQNMLGAKRMDTSAGFIVDRALIDSAFAYADSMALVPPGHHKACGLLMYVGVNQNMLHLYWQPVYPDTFGNSIYHTQYIYANNGTQRLLIDHTLPCPECGVRGAAGHIWSR